MYGALTDAMEVATRSAARKDPDAAVSAWKMADQTFSENVQALSSLGRALKSPADEALLNQVLGMAAEKSGNANRLVALQQHIGPDNMRTLGAHVLEQAGKAGEDWSPAKFVTNMNKLSNTSKSLFFPQTRSQVDDLVALAARWKEQEGKFANRSNTGRAALGGAAIGALAAHPVLAIGKAIAGAGVGATVGMVLSRPATAKAAVQLAQAQMRLNANPSPAAANAYYALQRRLARLVALEFAGGQTERPKEDSPRLQRAR
jgi:hypothetical protein